MFVPCHLMSTLQISVYGGGLVKHYRISPERVKASNGL